MRRIGGHSATSSGFFCLSPTTSLKPVALCASLVRGPFVGTAEGRMPHLSELSTVGTEVVTCPPARAAEAADQSVLVFAAVGIPSRCAMCTHKREQFYM